MRPAIPFFLGVAAGIVVVEYARMKRVPVPSMRRNPGCRVSVLFFEPENRRSYRVNGIYGRMINAGTGRHGFSHVAIDGCEVDDEGQPLVIDADMGKGVSRRRLSEFTEGQPPAVRAILPREIGAETYGCARAMLGLSYSLAGVMDQDACATCTHLLWHCLPPHARPPKPATRPISPNDFARYWGIHPRGPDVLVTPPALWGS